MRLVYIISAYKHPAQLVRLVNRIHTPTSVILIHVDKRTEETQYREMVSGVEHLTNLVFLKRHNCHWGDFGHLRATLKGLAYLRQHKEYDYVFLLTGQDYPIKSNLEVDEFLGKANKRDFISYWPLPYQGWRLENYGFERIENWHFRLFHRYIRVPIRPQSYVSPQFNLTWKRSLVESTLLPLNVIFNKRKLPANFKPFGGSGYWCITRRCVEYINDFVEKHQKFVKFFKYVNIPDEIFFQTVLLNSPLKHNIVNDNLRCMDWPGPRIWKKENFEILAGSKALFARKFDASVDSEILDLIDSKLLGLSATRPWGVQRE
jgi:hypothetical protein